MCLKHVFIFSQVFGMQTCCLIWMKLTEQLEQVKLNVQSRFADLECKQNYSKIYLSNFPEAWEHVWLQRDQRCKMAVYKWNVVIWLVMLMVCNHACFASSFMLSASISFRKCLIFGKEIMIFTLLRVLNLIQQTENVKKWQLASYTGDYSNLSSLSQSITHVDTFSQ